MSDTTPISLEGAEWAALRALEAVGALLGVDDDEEKRRQRVAAAMEITRDDVKAALVQSFVARALDALSKDALRLFSVIRYLREQEVDAPVDLLAEEFDWTPAKVKTLLSEIDNAMPGLGRRLIAETITDWKDRSR